MTKLVYLSAVLRRIHPRLYSTQGQGYGRARDRVKDEVAKKHTKQTAERQSNLGSSKLDEGTHVDGPPAAETVEQGEPFPHSGDQGASQHGGSTSSRHRDEYAGRGKPSEGATPSSAGEEGVRSRGVREDNSQKAENMNRESRDTCGYSQTGGGSPTGPPTGAGLSAFGGAVSTWFTMAPSHSIILASPSLHSFGRSMSTSSSWAAASSKKESSSLSTEEENSIHARGQRPNGSSPQSGVDRSSGPQRESNDDVDHTRSKTQSGVDPHYKRASGMPSGPAEEAMNPVSPGSLDTKQPQKDKGVVQSIKDSLPRREAEDTECNAVLSGGGEILKSIKERVGKAKSIKERVGEAILGNQDKK
ncbi:hypothetical protein CF326_g576 [Tilletia indica]|uniref:Uncharacterized protein n=1 Tax=Tilletia indica TaxID=43049 RepID=A0A177TBF5_9BASI|nr:hypothetical protein CF326_g576 [Tilletia indica]KAE8255752.1 hypothetical protein A4X13_0g2927 [Tilletia indica]